ncbi:polysaccharide lyase 8 family protein [Streptomyces sp. Je 1-79]|uniref:polysaccharide lyase 8 family protein n=1 Tax=Streptomyces sp. Je 1-79 TaxID=2943847 RepID=UPI0021A692B1|nr:polysaccharide lyase 8 family protein [Streptomyces sp. Je 1-79]MCT4351808.1 polysaccharide lyase 8 family protein [Streptomyces sp. Je 1-79]
MTSPTAAPFAAQRARWRDLLLGPGHDATEPRFARRLAELGTVAAAYLATMDPAEGHLWPGHPYHEGHGIHLGAGYLRLRTMALAHAHPGTGVTGDEKLADGILRGLDHVHDHIYNSAYEKPASWWWWSQVGAPQAMLDTCVLLYDRLGDERIARICAAVDRALPRTRLDRYEGQSTGANRVDFCRTLAQRGVLGDSATALTHARDGLDPVFPHVTEGDGFYADGSFVQHRTVAYTGAYGAVLLEGLATLFTLLDGTPWEVTGPGRQLALDTVEHAFVPFVHDGVLDASVCGRGISRRLTGRGVDLMPVRDHGPAQSLMAAVMVLGECASPAERARWRGIVKGWLRRDTFLRVADNPRQGIADFTRFVSLLDDPSVDPLPEPAGHRLFPTMARAVHRGPGWAAFLSMSSSTIAFYECGNQENTRGWHTGSGMLSWYAGDSGQYADAYWPTVDAYRLPGTTVSTRALADNEGGEWGARCPDTVWAGGATDGRFAAVGQDTRGLSSSLRARKSWFFTDDAVICLGAGIRAGDGVPVETVVDNRRLGAGEAPALAVDGVPQPRTLPWHGTFPAARWAALDGHGGFVFPHGATLRVLCEERTGRWSDINRLVGSDEEIRRSYATLWLDHGTDPYAATYAYVLLPGADARATEERARTGDWLRILANEPGAQGVSVPALGLTAVNLWTRGSAGLVACDAPASVLVREDGTGAAAVHVADPTRTAGRLVVTWRRPVARVRSHDAAVRVLVTGESLTFEVDTRAGNGATHRIDVTLG